MWYPIAIVAGAVLLIVGAAWAAFRIGSKQGKSEIQQTIAEGEAERRAKDAEIMSKPSVDRPLGRMRPK